MRGYAWIALAAAGGLLTGCSGPEKRAAVPAAAAPESARIAQFYTTSPRVARGETALVCYGLKNAVAAWLEPPRQPASAAAIARCVEVSPVADTTYTLTAQGADGKTVVQELKITVGPARARIVNVNVSAVDVKAGEMVILCYTVEQARAVTIDPIGFRGGSEKKGCTTDRPRKSTTYTISAVGAGGDKDQERVTVRVR
jgi:hypothetical protein